MVAGHDQDGRVKMRRVPGELNMPDHVTKGKAWREIDELVRGVGGRMKVIKSYRGVENKGAD